MVGLGLCGEVSDSYYRVRVSRSIESVYFVPRAHLPQVLPHLGFYMCGSA